MLDGYVSLPFTCPKLYQEFERGNFVVQISSIQFLRIHYDQPNNKTINYIKGPIDFMNCARDELQSRWEIVGPKIAEYLTQVESKILKGTDQNDTHNYEHNPTHNAMFKEN